MKRFAKEVLLPLARNAGIGLALLMFAAQLLYTPNLKASQASCIMPTTGTVTGLTLVNDINACNGSLLSLYSGASAPGSPTTNMLWANTTTNFVQYYDGTNWINLWFVDATNHLTSIPIGGGVVSGSIASAATTDIGSLPQAFVQVSLGTSPVTSFGSSATVGTVHVVMFTGIMTLTHNATSLILPGGQPIVTAAGDVAIAIYLGGGNWRVLVYSPASGAAVTNAAVALGTILYGDFMTLPPKTVYGTGQALSRSSFPGYTAAVSRTQSMTRSTGNATLTAVADTSAMGAGMPVEGPGISTGCTIASVVANTSITLNNSTCVTASGSASISVFGPGYGAGGDSTTIGVKDCRNAVLAGRGDMNGTDRALISSAVFGANPLAINAIGGSQNTAMAAGNLIQHLHPVFLNDPGHSHGVTGGTVGGTTGLGGQGGSTFSVPASTASIIISSAVTGMTVRDTTGGGGTANQTANTGSASPTPMRTIQPTAVANCVVVVSP